ncbi:MAG TPA: hypothetical protein VGD78_04170 [Chthoniobacterales bacterium]
MIQPLRPTREIWGFDWFDLDVPIQFGSMFILPTCLYVVHRFSGTLVGHEFVRELEQRRVELFLHRLFQERGVPDELQMPQLEEWDEGTWQSLSREFRCQINLIDRKGAATGVEPKIESQLSSLVTGPAENLLALQGPNGVAQGLVQAVRQTRGKDKKRALLRKAMELAPDLPEALLELGDLELQDGEFAAASDHFGQAADAAFPSHVPDEPGAYLKACHGQMLAAWQGGDLQNAINVGEGALQDSPTDYSGFRFLVPLLQLAAGQLEQADEYFTWYQQTYPQDLEDPGLMFGWAYTLFESDDEKGAAKKYRRAMLQNFYIAPLLLDLPEPSPDLWQHNDRGDLQFALDFVDSFGGIWEQSPSATRFLRESYVGALPRLETLFALRAKMAEFQDHRYEPDHRRIWDGMMAEEQQLVKGWDW